MSPNKLIDQLDPHGWIKVPVKRKLQILVELRDNLNRHKNDLGSEDIKMKNGILGENLFEHIEGVATTVIPTAYTLTSLIDLYQNLVNDSIPKPLKVIPIGNNYFDIKVSPRSLTDKILYSDKKDFIRVKAKPIQKNPLHADGGIIAVLGAGNFSSAFEIFNALFLENCVVIHKPHPLNQKTDRIWEKILQPLVELKAIRFCDAHDGENLISDSRLKKIYFTGGANTAKKIKENTSTPLISECGGNNPCIIVPGLIPWTIKQIRHQAQQIAAIGKLNGGAVCGRIQTIVTSKNWPQRDLFLSELRDAIENSTFAISSYYPGSQERMDELRGKHKDGITLKPENGLKKNSDFFMVTNVEQNSFIIENEAFCLAINEIALDVDDSPAVFLPKAVEFCNTQLPGTLAASLIIDEKTKEKFKDPLDNALMDLKYGAIGINTMPPFIWLNPYLYWGAHQDDPNHFSGHGHFGNTLNFVNVEKSITYCNFMSISHILATNKKHTMKLMENLTSYTLNPNIVTMSRLISSVLASKILGKDF